jgi:hypothetical protein
MREMYSEEGQAMAVQHMQDRNCPIAEDYILDVSIIRNKIKNGNFSISSLRLSLCHPRRRILPNHPFAFSPNLI